MSTVNKTHDEFISFLAKFHSQEASYFKDALENLDRVSEILSEESDRGAVLVGVAMLDDLLRGVFRVKFHTAAAHSYIQNISPDPDHLTVRETVQRHKHASESCMRALKLGSKMLTYPGALSTAAARQELAFCLGWIIFEVYNDLDKLRKLRNDAAHLQQAVSMFDNLETRQILQSLRFSDKQLASNQQSYRSNFVSTILRLARYLLELTITEMESTEKLLL